MDIKTKVLQLFLSRSVHWEIVCTFTGNYANYYIFLFGLIDIDFQQNLAEMHTVELFAIVVDHIVVLPFVLIGGAHGHGLGQLQRHGAQAERITWARRVGVLVDGHVAHGTDILGNGGLLAGTMLMNHFDLI